MSAADATPKPATEPHNFTHTGAEVLILRRCNKDRTSKLGFVYPSGVGTAVEAPDKWWGEDRAPDDLILGWDASASCGGGLHGWPWGFGLGDEQEYDLDDLWLVIGAKPEDVVGNVGDCGWKCKFRHGVIRYEGTFMGALAMLRDGFHECIKAMAAVEPVDVTIPATTAGKNYAQLASSGYGAQLASSGAGAQLASSGDGAKLASSGDGAKLASSGDGAKLASSGYGAKLASSGYGAKLASSGYGAQLASSGDGAKLASSGDGAKLASSGYGAQLASSGDGAKLASSGDGAKLASSGYGAQLASSGDGAKLASSGDGAKLASSGDGAKLASSGYGAKLASSGDGAKLASSGYGAKLASSGYGAQLASSGKDAAVALVSSTGKVKVGERGAFALACWSDDGWTFLVGKVGVDGIKPDTWYEVRRGKIVEVAS